MLFLPCFPREERFILEGYSLLYYPRFCHSRTLITVTVRTSRESRNNTLMTDRRPGTGCVRDHEQYVHRSRMLDTEQSCQHRKDENVPLVQTSSL